MAISIVVDTDIVVAASTKSSADHARLCAKILDEIEKGNFFLAMSVPIKKEWLSSRDKSEGWDKYLSVYAFNWLIHLQNRQRVRMYFELDQKKGDIILSGFSDKNVQKRVRKDLHIVLTALLADNRIISNNSKERYHLRNSCKWSSFLKELIWPVPLKEVPEWLSQGAPKNSKYILCNSITKIASF